MKLEVGALVREELFTTNKGEVVDRYGVIVKDKTGFEGYVEVVWQPRQGHPVATEAHQQLAHIDKLEVIVPSTMEDASR